MQIIFPADSMTPSKIDNYFNHQIHTFNGNHAVYSLEEEKVSGLTSGESVVYRGWMLDSEGYKTLTSLVEAKGCTMRTSLQQYLNTHHIPNWYPLLKDFTPETVWFTNEQLQSMDIVAELQKLGWHKFLLKDYVKSLKTAGGSMIDNAGVADRVIQFMSHFRGGLEGGLCVRRFETFGEETRYFISNGQICSMKDALPTEVFELLQQVANRIDSLFFSVDIAYNEKDVPRVVEIGDGQVSDLVGWSPQRFVDVLLELQEISA